MNTRERFHAVMNFRPFDRLPILEWAEWWDKTIGRWHGEGLPVDVTDRYAICRHFGLDVYKQDWIDAAASSCPQPRSHGSGIIDSDGDISVPLQWFEEAGLAGILPLERQAGVDIALLRARHPRMRFVGHFDKMTMDKGEARMRAEFERLLPTAARGGFLIGCDHQTPPGVSYTDYLTYLELFREYAGKAGAMS